MEDSLPAICEACGNAMAKRGDLLCGDCSRAFTLMLDILHRHPDISATDLGRVKEVFEWQTRKRNPEESPNGRSSSEGQSESAVISVTDSDLGHERTGEACEVCGNFLTESDDILCADCSRAHAFVLELFRESAPLVQSRLQAHPELTADDLNRIRRVFMWRSGKIGLVESPPQADVAVRA